jgi:hypothetical protein
MDIMTAEERYEDLVVAFNDTEGVTPPTRTSGFGRAALRYRGKIFAMFVRGQLVVKLPKNRVTELVETGRGARFDANKGTPMREWFALEQHDDLDDALWLELATEALEFARSR